MGLSGTPVLCILDSPYYFGDPAPVGYSLLYVMLFMPPSALMVLSRFINLFLYLLVGSVVNLLYVGCLSISSDFFIYSSLFMTTMDTSLLVVRIIFSLSLFSSWMALASSLFMFGFGGCMFLRMDLISPHNSLPSLTSVTDT